VRRNRILTDVRCTVSAEEISWHGVDVERSMRTASQKHGLPGVLIVVVGVEVKGASHKAACAMMKECR